MAKKVKQAAHQSNTSDDAAMDELDDQVTDDEENVDQAGKTAIAEAPARKGRPSQRAAAKDVDYTDASVKGNTGKYVAVVEVRAPPLLCVHTCAARPTSALSHTA